MWDRKPLTSKLVQGAPGHGRRSGVRPRTPQVVWIYLGVRNDCMNEEPPGRSFCCCSEELVPARPSDVPFSPPFFFFKDFIYATPARALSPSKGLGLPSTLCWLPRHLGHIPHAVPQPPHQSKRTSGQPIGDTPGLHLSTSGRLGVDIARAEAEAASSGMHGVVFLLGKLRPSVEELAHISGPRGLPRPLAAGLCAEAQAQRCQRLGGA